MAQRLDEPWRLPGLEIDQADAPQGPDWLRDCIVSPPSDIAAHVLRGELELAESRDADAALFTDAAKAISAVPSLAAIVATRVGSVHLLRADPGYDLSHSEPQWRDRIFVSVPERSDQVGALRLAEGVIHEALHLHLTELEAICPLIRDPISKLPSPWRPEPRSYGGVLHGTFVFVCLKAYFDIFAERSDSPAGLHILKRRAEIGGELAEVDLATLTTGLTRRGVALLQRLLRCHPRVGAEA